MFTDCSKAVLLVGHLCYFLLVFVMFSRLFIAALWSPAGKGLTSWLSFVILNYVLVTFLGSILGQVWYLIVSFLIFATFFTSRFCAYAISTNVSAIACRQFLYHNIRIYVLLLYLLMFKPNTKIYMCLSI